MKLRSGLTVVAPILLAILAPSAARAITNGHPDGNGHPYVGMLVAELETPGIKRGFCSGALVAPHAVVTAAHCAGVLKDLGIPYDQMWVTFDPAFRSGVSKVYRGTFVPAVDPDHFKGATYAGQYGNSNGFDIGVVHLVDAPPITPGTLPTAGLLSTLDLRNQPFTAVGYGATRVDQTKGMNNISSYSEPVIRNVGEPHGFLALHSYNITYDENPVHGHGGACFGDSGGPSLLGNSDVIVSLASRGDSVCRATAEDYRLDTDFARQFLASQGVPLP